MSSYVKFALLFVWFSGTVAIPLSNFYTFGGEAGDNQVPAGADGASPAIVLPRLFRFGGTTQEKFYVNHNGLISFGNTLSGFSSIEAIPRIVGSLPILAPFWGHVLTSSSGTIWYGERSNDISVLNRARSDIRQYFSNQQPSDLVPDYVFVSTWDRVPYVLGPQTNTFQCVIITTRMESYVLFLYADNMIGWTTGLFNGGVNGLGGREAEIGYDAGDQITFERVPLSDTPAAINITSTSNVGVGGVWAFTLYQETSCDFKF